MSAWRTRAPVLIGRVRVFPDASRGSLVVQVLFVLTIHNACFPSQGGRVQGAVRVVPFCSCGVTGGSERPAFFGRNGSKAVDFVRFYQ